MENHDWAGLAARAQWQRSYADDGYVVVENAVEQGYLAQMRDALERIERAVADETLSPSLRGFVTREKDRTGESWGSSDSNAISLIMELPLFDPIFRDLIIYPRVLDVLEALFDSTEFAFFNYKCIAKMPGGDAPFRWHRDLPYLEHTGPNLITCMLCLDDMTTENGATVVCPGSHLISHDEVKHEDIDIAPADVPDNRLTVECPAGSAVLFHVNLIHGGGPNRSAAKRRNVISIWEGPHTHPIGCSRFVYSFVKPRSTHPERQKQIDMTFQRGK